MRLFCTAPLLLIFLILLTSEQSNGFIQNNCIILSSQDLERVQSECASVLKVHGNCYVFKNCMKRKRGSWGRTHPLANMIYSQAIPWFSKRLSLGDNGGGVEWSKRGMGDFVFDKKHYGSKRGNKRGMGDFVFDKKAMGDFVFDKKHYGSKRGNKRGMGDFVFNKRGMGDFVFDKRAMSIGGDEPEVEWMKRALLKRNPKKRQFTYWFDKRNGAGHYKHKRPVDKRQYSYFFDKRNRDKKAMSIGDDDVGIEWSKRSRSKRLSIPHLAGPSIPWSV